MVRLRWLNVNNVIVSDSDNGTGREDNHNTVLRRLEIFFAAIMLNNSRSLPDMLYPLKVFSSRTLSHEM